MSHIISYGLPTCVRFGFISHDSKPSVMEVATEYYIQAKHQSGSANHLPQGLPLACGWFVATTACDG